MNQKEPCSNGQRNIPLELENASDKKMKCNRDRHSVSPNLTNAEIHTNREKYDGSTNSPNEAQPSASLLTRKFYSACNDKEYTINSNNHYQDLNDKFQQLEHKMFEVEKCFKKANRMEMVPEEQKSLSGGTSASHDKNFRSVHHPTRIETRNTSEGFDTNVWVGSHNFSTTSDADCENEIVKNNYGSGDKISLHKSDRNSSTKLSNDTCNTMIDVTEQSSYQFPHKRTMAKSYLTMHKLNGGPKDEIPQSHYFEENHKFTDVDLLEKSKKLILGLIDKELQKIEAKPHQITLSNIAQVSKMTTDTNHRHLKMECIQNIEKELKMLKQLEESLEL